MTTARDLVPLLDFLDHHHVVHLSTTGDGGPIGAPVFFARLDDSGAIVWNSAIDALHSKQVDAGGPMAVSVAPSSPSMLHIEGVQMRGQGSSAADVQDAAAKAYYARFPAARAMVLAAKDHRFYVFRPRWARMVRLIAGVSRTVEFNLA